MNLYSDQDSFTGFHPVQYSIKFALAAFSLSISEIAFAFVPLVNPLGNADVCGSVASSCHVLLPSLFRAVIKMVRASYGFIEA